MRKRWVEENRVVLYFEPFGMEEIKIAEIFYDTDSGWCYSSSLLDATEEYLGSDTLEDAKSDVECLVESHYEDEINYYSYLLDEFKQ